MCSSCATSAGDRILSSLEEPTTLPLLSPADPAPYQVLNEAGRSRLVLVGDHAGNVIPSALGDLGISREDQQRHIAWDIGIAGLGEGLADRLDAVFVRQTFSRLVIDCNRDPASPIAMPEVSDMTIVPGNAGLDEEARAARASEIHAPYHDAIAAQLAAREAPILIALHSFTPNMNGSDRPWHAGILHAGHEDAYSLRLLKMLQDETGLVVGDNEPYRLDAKDYTVPRHTFAAGLPYAEIEIRQDLIADAEGVVRWAELLGRLLPAAI